MALIAEKSNLGGWAAMIVKFLDDVVVMGKINEQLELHPYAEYLQELIVERPKTWVSHPAWKDIIVEWEWFEGNFAQLASAYEAIAGPLAADDLVQCLGTALNQYLDEILEVIE
jgi:hypothetical protein